MIFCERPNGISSVSCVQVGGQVGTPKTVNSLLGIANHQKSADRLLGLYILMLANAYTINTCQRFILPGVCVLKFIYQCHWKLGPNNLR